MLPFELSPANPDAEFLSDGLTESIINSLSELPNLRVVPRSTVFRYRAFTLDVPSVGRELDATHVLTGRVAVRGDALKVQVELVESATNRQLWGRLYTRRTSDLSALQDALAHDIIAALKLRLSAKSRRPARSATDNSDAYQDFLRGRYFLNQYTPDGFVQAIRSFERAIAKDPQYALAHAELANAIGTARFFGYLPPDLSDQRSKDAMDRALELDPLLPEAHSARAKRAFFHERDWATAQAHFERALELKPDYAECRMFFALYHAALGRSERALVEGRRATEDTPLFGLIQAGFALVQIFSGQVEAGIEQARRALAVDPGNAIALKELWFANAHVGRFDEALNALAAIAPAIGLPSEALTRLRTAYQTGGDRAFWEELLKVTRDAAARRYVPPHEFLFIYSYLGDIDRVLEYAERCVEINAGLLVFLAVDPCFDRLRADSRFQDLLRRLGLPVRADGAAEAAPPAVFVARHSQEGGASAAAEDRRPKTDDRRPTTEDDRCRPSARYPSPCRRSSRSPRRKPGHLFGSPTSRRRPVLRSRTTMAQRARSICPRRSGRARRSSTTTRTAIKTSCS